MMGPQRHGPRGSRTRILFTSIETKLTTYTHESCNNGIHGYLLFKFAIALCSFMAISSAQPSDMSTAFLIRVDQSGNGDYKKIQDAIDAVPSNNSELVFIWIKSGTYRPLSLSFSGGKLTHGRLYIILIQILGFLSKRIHREKVVVPANKHFITLNGTLATTTIITWSERRDIFDSPTLSVLASDFEGRFLTIQNTFGAGAKAVALRVSGDRAAFYGCRILSHQDTLLADAGRHYYSNCYIEGDTDFICGNAASLFEVSSSFRSAISIRLQKELVLSWHNAESRLRRTPATPSWVARSLVYKFTVVKLAIVPTAERLYGDGCDVTFPKFLAFGLSNVSNKCSLCFLCDRTVYYWQYKCYGPGADTAKRVPWLHNLTSAKAAPFLTKNMIGDRGWLRPSPTRFKKKGA
ncbi:hypothetical protein HHK36_002500 [Tetracentron sinense]|uniref:pectinesterase n=1 Tax=Tetracentron sinense TaxID=13715 RepID=A0A834ZQF1_TETSI|nr:hypothetical protein HHK36_002500 [Tetracentron sinense]